MAYGQTKYIQIPGGQVLDTLAYAEFKAAKIDKMKSLLPTKDVNVSIEDNLKEIKRTKDSLIYTYKWEIKIGEPIVKDKKSFELADFIDKEFPLPILKTLDGKEIGINDLIGKPTLINSWFTTCKPCIEEMPVLSDLKNKLNAKMNFIAITYESTEKVSAFFKKHKFNFIQIPSAKKFTDSMNMEAFPVNIFLDKNGIVRKIENGIPYVLDDKKQIKMGDGKEFMEAL
jgi:thiol-disulfide isomerase/thioredoxin